MKLLDISTPKHPNTFTMVDDEDFEWLSKWKWHAAKVKKSIYVRRAAKRSEGMAVCTVFMHRFIMNPPIGFVVDHIDGNGLNNQKSNMRVCTIRENGRNVSKMHGKSSIYKGVTFVKEMKKYRAAISDYSGKRVHLGFFIDPKEGAKAYNDAAIKYHGKFAKINEGI